MMRMAFKATFLGVLCGLGGFLGMANQSEAHHILGRPAYSLNEDSNTPPSMQAEVQLGEYRMTYMLYPAFPRPGGTARISLYILGTKNGTPFDGRVTFTIREMPWNAWLGSEGHADRLGVQPPDDKVYRQGFTVPEAGEYMISADFQIDGEPYTVDFPVRIGEPPLIGPMAMVAGGLLLMFILIAVMRRRKSMTARMRATRQENV
ncbi:MAG: hypothetical protein HN732_10320 [Rhodospirillaceae bacterium]|jgi:hypothetical protein|nr:hypothetical protein [Rhodospirillaceae bacterium]